MPGINFYELIVLLVLAMVIIGPQRLPEYAKNLTNWVRKLRSMADDAKDKFKEETGTDFNEVDWRKYDPRQYDPRRIIRDALREDTSASRALDTVGIDSDMRQSMRTAGQAANPRELFGAGAAGSTGAGASQALQAGAAGAQATGAGAATTAAAGAAAAGMAGAALAGAQPEAEAAAEPVPAPFDDEAT